MIGPTVANVGTTPTDTGIQRRRAQVVGSGDGMDVTGQVQVEILHRDDLRVPAAGGTTFNAESWSLRRLADHCHDTFAEMCAEGL